MQDAVYTPSLSSAYSAFGGYLDGRYPTAAYVLSRFPNAHHLFYTTGLGPAEGIDVEPGNAGWDQGFNTVAAWIKWRRSVGVVKPVVYLPASSVVEMILVLAGNGVPRSNYRLFPAHWTGEPHICSSQDIPSSFAWEADATQFEGNIGGAIFGYDLSLCADDFFTPTAIPAPAPIPAPPAPPPLPEEDSMEYLVESTGPTVKAQPLSRKKYPQVEARDWFIVDPSQNLKIAVIGEQLPLYIALMTPSGRVFSGKNARSCAELAAVPSA